MNICLAKKKRENLVQFNRLRHDVISNKVQINDGMIRADALNDEMMNAGWRDITTSDKLVIKGSIKKPMSMVQLGMLLKKSGFQSKQCGPSRTRGWLVRERSADEVNANRNIEGRTP